MMLTGALLAVLVMLALGLSLRGDPFHTHLVHASTQALQGAGFATKIECSCSLPTGGTAYIDIVAVRRQSTEALTIACEVETTPRNVLRNVRKVQSLGLPLLIVIPNRAVKSAVINRLQKARDVDLSRIWILLPDELAHLLASCFSSFPAANGQGKTGKQATSPRQPRKVGPCR